MGLRHHPPPDRSRRPPQRVTVPECFEWTRAAGVGPSPAALGDLTNRRVIELGCGAGHNLAHLVVHHHAQAVGIDCDPTKVRRARRAYGVLSNLTFFCAEATAFLREQPTASFDLGLSIFGAFSFGAPEPLLAELSRVLRPGGKLALSFRATDRTDLVLILIRR